MGKKHKHEEHVNHERWVISFADMMTLLFALFVVLYAMGVQDLEKLKKLKKSIQFAFNISGSGKTQDAGIFEQQSGAGEVALPAPLLNAQEGAMKEFMKDVLEEYEEVAGKSLDIVQTDDTISLTAPLSDFFAPGKTYPVKRDVQGWFDRTVDASLSFSSTIRITIKTPKVPIGRDTTGRVLTSEDLCLERLKTLGRVVANNPQVRDGMVAHEWSVVPDQAGAVGSWEDQARVVVSFSNTRAENR
ncbi:MAG: flagellar motor protein MotB [Planctomycetota bacterium]